MTANLMDDGTVHHNAEKIADEFGQMGTAIDITAGHDFTTFEADALVNSSGKLLDLFSEIIMQPNFADVEISRHKVQVVSMLTKKLMILLPLLVIK